jgi:hypothetical protein
LANVLKPAFKKNAGYLFSGGDLSLGDFVARQKEGRLFTNVVFLQTNRERVGRPLITGYVIDDIVTQKLSSTL